jgi:hypothetical protein
LRPAVEPRTGAARVDARAGAEVLAKVEEHVDQRVPHFAGRMEGVGVIAVDPDWAAAVDGAIDGAGTADGETLHTADQCRGTLRFHDEVQVIGLHGELGQAKRAAT